MFYKDSVGKVSRQLLSKFIYWLRAWAGVWYGLELHLLLAQGYFRFQVHVPVCMYSKGVDKCVPHAIELRIWWLLGILICEVRACRRRGWGFAQQFSGPRKILILVNNSMNDSGLMLDWLCRFSGTHCLARCSEVIFNACNCLPCELYR